MARIERSEESGWAPTITADGCMVLHYARGPMPHNSVTSKIYVPSDELAVALLRTGDYYLSMTAAGRPRSLICYESLLVDGDRLADIKA